MIDTSFAAAETTKKRGRAWLGRPWQGGELGVPAAAGAVLAAAGYVFHKLDVHWVMALVIAVVVFATMLGSVFDGDRFAQRSQGVMALAGLCVGAELVWSTNNAAWDIEFTVWSMSMLSWTIVVWAAQILVFTLLWYRARHWQLDKEDQLDASYLALMRSQHAGPPQPTVAPPPPEDPNKARWESMPWGGAVRRGKAANKEMGLTYVGQVTTGEGHPAIHMRVPADGSVTIDSLMTNGCTSAIEVVLAAGGQPLPPGSVFLERVRQTRPDGTKYASSTDFLVHINATNILEQTIWYTKDNSTTTVGKLFTIGRYQDGAPFQMTMRQINWWINAQTRSGKSNLLHRIIYHLSRCSDAVVFVTDLKGGNVIKPWVRPWYERALNPKSREPVLRPIIDWAGVDRFEIQRIWEFALAVVETRPFKRQSGNEHVPTRKDPLLVFISDEHGSVVGSASGPATKHEGLGLTSSDFGALEELITGRSGSEGVVFIKTSLRATVTVAGPGDANNNYLGVATLIVADQQEAGMAAGKGQTAAHAAAITTKGTMMVTTGGILEDRDVPVKIEFMGDREVLDANIYEAAVHNGNIVPGLTEGTWLYDLACEYGYQDRYTDPQRINWLTGNFKGRWRGKPIEVKTDENGEAAEPDDYDSPSKLEAEMEAVRAAEGRVLESVPKDEAPDPGPGSVLLDGVEMDPEVVALIEAAERELAGEGPQLQPESAAEAEAGEASNVDKTVQVVRGFGVQGATYSKIAAKMLDLKYLFPSNVTSLSRWLKTAKGDGRLVQNGERGRWVAADLIRKAA